MTERERERIVEAMFPDWTEHLNDGKVLDHIVEELARCGAKSAKYDELQGAPRAAPEKDG
jgi:hypothetical protein